MVQVSAHLAAEHALHEQQKFRGFHVVDKLDCGLDVLFSQACVAEHLVVPYVRLSDIVKRDQPVEGINLQCIW